MQNWLRLGVSSIAWMGIDVKPLSDGLTLSLEILRKVNVIRRTATALMLLRRHNQTHYALTVLRQIEAGQQVTLIDDRRTWQIFDVVMPHPRK